VLSIVIFVTAAVGYIAFLRPTVGLEASGVVSRLPLAQPAMNAYGRSGGVRMVFARPGAAVDYPLEIGERPEELTYFWRSETVGKSTEPRSLSEQIVAPSLPGFYHLAVRTSSGERVFDGLSLAVMVPFEQKSGSMLNGYRIGRYAGERRQSLDDPPPPGFVQIGPSDVDLPVSSHLRISDFVSHDEQTTWPRYAALDARLLDKLELVFAEIGRWQGQSSGDGVDVNVHSGFRTPIHNRRVARSARDSRHQYGDAADIAVDVNRDGRINSSDVKLVAKAVEIVEHQHPDLVGGLGLYTGSATYVHIDARGERKRWRG
jgi:hypothetical protein